MLGTYFYHQNIRKTIIAFGNLFNNITVKSKDADGDTFSQIRVPLSYGPTQKFLARLEQQADLNKPVAITLPRISFEMNSLKYDPSRKTGITQTFKSTGSDDKTRKVYMPIPYNIGFELNIMTKFNDEVLQIVEQILPFFQPSFTVTVDMTDVIDEKKDVPIVLDSVSFRDDYEGDFSTRRAIIYTLGFTAKTYLYGPVSDAKFIKKAIADIYSEVNTSTAPRNVRYQVVPDPITADSDDDFGFGETWSDFSDNKKRNPTSGVDEVI